MVFMTLFTAAGIAFMAVASVIFSIFSSMTGLDVSKITLPYNPEEGLVWEYDNENDPYIKLKDMVIEGDEQIFKFVNRGYNKDITYKYGCGYMMDLVFTAENGETETYYATTRNVSLGRVKIWAEDEVFVYDYTATAKKVYDDSEWEMDFGTDSDSEYVVYNPDTESTSRTFTVVYEKGMDEDDIIWVSFDNRSGEGDYWEAHHIKLDCSGKEAKLLEESFWSTDSL